MTTEKSVIDQYLKNIHPDIVRYAFDEKISVTAAAEITANVNLDTDVYVQSCMLAQIGMRDGFEGFRPDTVPRLRGLYRYAMVRDGINHKKCGELVALLAAHGIDFICGYNLSLKMGYTKRDTLVSASHPDIIVRKRQYEKTCSVLRGEEVRIRVSDDDYIWKNAIVLNEYGKEFRILNPTAILLLYGSKIWSSLLYSGGDRVDSLFDRMTWLYRYKVICSFPETIDSGLLAEKTSGDSRAAIRFILRYAQNYFGEVFGKAKMAWYFPEDNDYRNLLEMMSERENNG